MPIILSDIICPVGTPDGVIIKKALKILSIGENDADGAGIYKKSLDARKRSDIKLVCSVLLRLKSPELELRLSQRKNVRAFMEEEPTVTPSAQARPGKTVIAGFGPAGMFCALTLAEAGYRPIVIERGADADTRTAAVEGFWNGGPLDPETNVQFGEGGAGTFSDGKLTTRIGDPLCRWILKRFCEMGAPGEIMYSAKPHIGTDRLREVVKNIRKRVTELGGEVKFLTRLDDIDIRDSRVMSVNASGEKIDTAALVLAIGHSARDTFSMLLNNGVFIEPKAFSVGARIEHRQRDVDISLYGRESGEAGLPKGEYQLSYRSGGRAAYTFCMCPGGDVVAAASEPCGVVTNGMSRYARDGENANAAVAVSVDKGDFPPGPLGGVDFARSIEQKAYRLTGSYIAPAMTAGSLMDGSKDASTVVPSYRPGVMLCDITALWPKFVTDMLRSGLSKFSREMKCFGDRGALLTAPETRTSSPVRITRGEGGTALGIENLYPCGEGAGYAGGIMSAAVDGVRTAMKIISSYAPE